MTIGNQPTNQDQVSTLPWLKAWPMQLSWKMALT